MMKKITLLSIGLCFSLLLFASSGDTLTIQAHHNVDLHWQGSSYGGKYDEVVNFPTNSTSFQDIEMEFSIGCNNAGVCSHWDYDINIYVGEYAGYNDSTIASFDTLNYQAQILDTLSTNPFVFDTLQNYIFEADTNWNVFEVIIWHEMGRMITPYGTYMDDQNMNDGFDNTWLHRYKYNVTDFRPFLNGQTPIRVHYHGWQDGWRVNTKFKFVEGKPTRDVVNVENIYSGGNYTSFSQFDAASTPTKTINIAEDVEEAKLRVFVTGHGQYGEFTPIKYKVKSGTTVVKEESIWRDDCGMLPLSPQGGTWIFNRANWCPGDAVKVQEFDLSDFIEGSGTHKTLNLNIDFDDFVPTDAAYYSMSVQLVTYKKYRRDYDVALEDIISPSTNENFVRLNALCASPKIRIKNNGKQTLTSAQIKYWVTPTNYRYFIWHGTLEYGETTDVTLDQMDWTGVDVANPIFYAEVSWPSDVVDQFSYNNQKSESFIFPDIYSTNSLKVRFRANNHPNENSFTLKSADGTLIADENTFNAQQINDFTYSLVDGCYVFEFYDEDDYWGLDGGGGDGISWWLNSQNNLESSGYLRFIDNNTNQTLKVFNPDFGTKIYYEFTIGDSLNELSSLPKHIKPVRPDIDTVIIDGVEYFLLDGIYYDENNIINNVNDLDNSLEILKMFPNPAKNTVAFYLETKSNQNINITITNVIGEKIDAFEMQTNKLLNYKIKDIASGIYFVNFEIEGKSSSRKLIIEK